MNRRRFRTRLLLALALPLIAWLAIAIPYSNSLMGRWQVESENFLLKQKTPDGPHPDIIIVELDDATLEEMNIKPPFPPVHFAELVEILNQNGALAIGFDFLYSEPSRECDPPNQDIILGQKLGEWGNVVWGVQIKEDGKIKPPIPVIRENLAAVGHLHFSEAEDRVIRDYHPLIGEYRSLAAALLETYAGFLPDTWMEGGRENRSYRIDYQGLSVYPKVSLASVLNRSVDMTVFQDKIVLVGPTFTGSQDRWATPFSRRSELNMAGVEIHATFLGNMLNNKVLTHGFSKSASLAMVILGAALAFLISFRHPWFAFAFWGFSVGGWGCIWLYQFLQNAIIIPVVKPWIFLTILFSLGIFLTNLVERKNRQEVRTLFSSLVDDDVVKWLLHNPDQIHSAGIRREVTVLDTDIAGFTTITNRIPPEDLVAQLNEYFEVVTTAAKAQGGMHDKFVGDALMMIYGFPQEMEDHAQRAVQAAMDIQQGIADLNRRWEAEGKPSFATRIGVATGEVVVGAVGAGHQKAITAMGDAANLAARLEAMNKEFGTDILVSAETARRCPEPMGLRSMGTVSVRGFDQEQEVFSPLKANGENGADQKGVHS